MNMQAEEEAIIAATRQFIDAWNRGDAHAAAMLCTEDTVRVGSVGDVQIGRTEIEAACNRLLHQTMPGAKAIQERGTVRMLTDDLAVWQARLEIEPPGTNPALKGYLVQIMKNVGAQWLILEAHPKFFPAR
jgi:uncharacterized protein (TIGR02246 family)